MEQPSVFSRFVRDPLVHFVVAGAAIFGLYSLVSDEPADRENQIVVDDRQVARITEQFERTWLRPPTGDELAHLIEDHVREEILYREALAMGLDDDDLVVRRRMRQKLEFMFDDLTAAREPSDEVLQAYLDELPCTIHTAINHQPTNSNRVFRRCFTCFHVSRAMIIQQVFFKCGQA